MAEWGSTDIENPIVKEKENHESTTTRPENNQTGLQAATQTAEDNTRTSGVQCDLLMISTTVAKNHHRGWLIPLTINQVLTIALLDTGAN